MTTRGWRIALLSGIVFLPVLLSGQTDSPTFVVPTTNSKAVVRQQVASTEIEVTYHRPSVKGRPIFGTLVPYGQVWRTGSDAATTIAFSTPVTLGGAPVDSGSYELFTIPGDQEWVVIIHENRSQWGSYAYDSSHDVARVTVRPVPLCSKVETFMISIDDVKTDHAMVNIAWDNLRVPVPIAIDVRATVVPKLEAALKADGRKPYFLAAMFYFENNLDIDRAAELMELAVRANPRHIGMLYRQALILERKGDRAGAIAAAERSFKGAQTSGAQLKEEYTRLNTALLDRLRKE